jgi:predicted Fe-Mo cluster-binding NifX family protein
MKIAVSVSKLDPGASFEPRFGRAAAFVLIDENTGEQQAVRNPASVLDRGAGIRAAEFLIRQGVEVVISGAFGPKAHDVLCAAGLRLYQANSGTASELLERWRNDELDVVEGN